MTREQAEDTIEGLQELISRGLQSVYLDMALAGMRQLLAAMDSEPVAYMYDGEDGREYNGHNEFSGGGKGIQLYSHAQQPVVPEDKPMPNPLSMYAVDAVAAIAEVKGWNACRAAMLQAGNSPVIPDGYVMVPKEPTKEMIDAGWLHFMGTKNPSSKGTYKAMLAAAPQDTPALNSVQSVATVPGKWIPVSERMPETDGNYWGWWSESKRQGPVWFIKSELQAQFQSSEITHWMPLPAAPQEVK